VRPAAQSKDLELQLRTSLPPDERIVRGDQGRLQQVVWNLLANAIKFTPKAGRVDVTLDQVEADGGDPEAGCARIRVRDSGQGIESDFLPFVFDRFRQADGTMTRKHGGLGLGLAIVRHLVELHGGSVRADSAGPGQGAVFTVTLPREILPAAVVPGPALPSGGPADGLLADSAPGGLGPTPLRGLSVLVVDDAPDTLRMLATLLGEAGAHVHSAESARAALALLMQQRPDVLISDLAMPGEDGFSLIAKVRALPPELGGEIPAIALTAHVRLADRARALAAGFQMFIAKPLEPRELLSVITDLAQPRRRD
jgi:CheY-like chemotaxis protein